MNGYGDGTNWSSERGDGPGYSGSTGNAGSGIGNSGSGGGASPNGPVKNVNPKVGEALARKYGINPAEFVSYVLGIEGNVLGITRGIVGDSYSVNLGYPDVNTFPGNSGTANSVAPGGMIPSNVDISEAREAALKKVIDDNAKWVNSGQSGTRITKARALTYEAMSELAVIYDLRSKEPPESILQEAAKALAGFYQTLADKYGDRANKFAQDLAEEAKGKRLRNSAQALAAFNQYRSSIASKFGVDERNAIAKAVQSADYAILADNSKRFSRALGYYGDITDIIDIRNEIVKALETNQWSPVFVKLETIVAGKVALAAVALAFGFIASVPLGIIGYALIAALVASLINDKSVKSINSYLGIK